MMTLAGNCLLQEVGKRMECSDGNDQILWPGCPHFVPYMPLGVIVPFLWLISYYIYISLSLLYPSFGWLGSILSGGIERLLLE
jgi:hypothetical protein